jgi:hypothetical protein
MTAAILVGVNLAVGRAARHSVPRQTIAAIDSVGSVIGVLGVGNSLMAAAFDAAAVEQTFQKAGRAIVAVNGALGASGPIEHLDLTRVALQHHMVQNLVYGFSEQQMSMEAPLKNSDLIGNEAMLYYDEPQLTLKYARFNWMEWVEFETYRCCALLRERSAIWIKVEKMRRAMQEVGMPHQDTNRFGRRADFELIEPTGAKQFTERCSTVIRSGDFIVPALQELFKEARSHGSRVTVVEMPAHPSHMKTFYDLPIWDEFRRLNRQAVERSGAAYLDASHWVPEESEYQDNLHLGASGAAQFSRMLAEHLIEAEPSGVTARRYPQQHFVGFIKKEPYPPTSPPLAQTQ